MDESLPLSGPRCPPNIAPADSDVPSCPEAPQEHACGSRRNPHRQPPTSTSPTPSPPPPPLPCPVPAACYHDEAAVEVEALAAALGHHDAGAQAPVPPGRQGEEQHVQARVDGQEEQVAEVVVPVGGGQWARAATARSGVGGRQPVGGTAGKRLGSEQRGPAGCGGEESDRGVGCGEHHRTRTPETAPPQTLVTD